MDLRAVFVCSGYYFQALLIFTKLYFRRMETLIRVTSQINLICPILDKFGQGQLKHYSISSKSVLGNLTILKIISKSHFREVAPKPSHSNCENPNKLSKWLRS